MFMVDPVLESYGFGYYPASTIHGFTVQPKGLDFYLRPYFAYHMKKKSGARQITDWLTWLADLLSDYDWQAYYDFLIDVTMCITGVGLCRWDVPDHEVVLKMWLQWLKQTKDKCHFSSVQVSIGDQSHSIILE